MSRGVKTSNPNSKDVKPINMIRNTPTTEINDLDFKEDMGVDENQTIPNTLMILNPRSPSNFPNLLNPIVANGGIPYYVSQPAVESVNDNPGKRVSPSISKSKQGLTTDDVKTDVESPRRPSILKRVSAGSSFQKKRVTLDEMNHDPEFEENHMIPSLDNVRLNNLVDMDKLSKIIHTGFTNIVRRKSRRKPLISKSVVNDKFTLMLIFTGFIITLSSFQYGWVIGVVNEPQKIVMSWYNQTHYERHGKYMTPSQITGYWALTVSIANLSGLFGGLTSGYFCDRLGRKMTLIVNNVFTFLAVVLILAAKSAKSYEMLIVARFILGYRNGITSGAVSIYLAEISPTNLRGTLCSGHQVMLSFAVLVSEVLGLPQLMGTDRLWPILFALSVIPALIQVAVLPFLPESPRYLLIFKEKELSARHALRRLRNSKDIDDEIEQMKVEYQDQKRLPPVTWADMVGKQVYRKPLIIASETSISQQLSALSAVLSYSTALFISTGISANNAKYASLAMGLMFFLLCTLSLLVIKRLGRRTLLLTGFGGMWFSTILITICLGLHYYNPNYTWASFLGVIFIFCYVGFGAVGPSVIAWFIPAELFTQSARSKGVSIAIGFNWLSSFLAVFLFPILLASLGHYIFLVFSILIALFWLYTYTYLPETQGRTPIELARIFMTPSELNRIQKFWRNHQLNKKRYHPHQHKHQYDTRL